MKNIGKYVLVVIVTAVVVAGVWLLASNFTKKDDSKSKNEIENVNNAGGKTTNTNNNDYAKANEAIRQVMMDNNQLKENMIKDDGTTFYFKKISDINDNPAYIVRAEAGDSSYAKVITYKGGNVVFSKEYAGGDYNTVKLDKNKNTIEAENQSTSGLKYYKIENGEIVKIDDYSDEDDYKKGKEKYKDYNFEEIDVEITSDNVNKNVK